MPPHVTDVPVRFEDLDAAGHVNNAVYATYIEEARIAYCRAILDVSVDELSFVIARQEIDYEAPITDLATVSIETTVPDVGEQSFPMEYDLSVNGSRVATARTVQVTVDPGERTPCPVPATWRSKFAEFEGH
ncbi:MAG: acyl-CoA thioesterase [Halobacteriaceae archaeon]